MTITMPRRSPKRPLRPNLRVVCEQPQDQPDLRYCIVFARGEPEVAAACKLPGWCHKRPT
jgi:hypothetical protein